MALGNTEAPFDIDPARTDAPVPDREPADADPLLEVRRDVGPRYAYPSPGHERSPERRQEVRGTLTPEDRSSPNGASNDRPIDILLDLAVRTLGGDRGFVVAEDHDGLRILASRAHAQRPVGEPSRSAVRAALLADRARVWVDLAGASPFADVASVHRLGLRALASAPVPHAGPRRIAVILDWRDARLPDRTRSTRLLTDLARLAGACLGLGAIPTAPVSPAAGRETSAGADDLVGRSEAFRAALDAAARAARCSAPVLIRGESGTGKEALARRIHASGPRSVAPFVAVNCASIPESLVEGELFGALRGAFTGAVRDRSGLFRRADGGTLFLDEIGDMPLATQAKLLRTLQERSVRAVGSDVEHPIDVRIVAATHRDLTADVVADRFRGDLFHRIAVLFVHAPPLRDRPEDLDALVPFLLDRLRERYGIEHGGTFTGTIDRLRRHAWPGNVRELEAVLARAAVTRQRRPIRAQDLEFLGPPLRRGASATTSGRETEMIEEALRAAKGSVTAAARAVGWTRQKMYRRMRALEVDR